MSERRGEISCKASLGQRAAQIGGVLVSALVFATLALAASLPQLTGRIVDQSSLLNAAARAGIETKLQSLEDKSGIQLVVATVRSLDGNDIETYANNLFRAWKLGEKQKNNGALLLIAPNERKMRIEVGYGLEGTLTDAMSRIIIANAIAPRFKAGDFSGGIERGVDDIIATLTGDSAEWQKRPQVREDDQQSLLDALMPILILLIFVFVILSIMRKAGMSGPGTLTRGRGGNVIFIPGGGFSGGFGGGSGGFSGGFGGGFSGGGGSSGGGGASGGW